MPYIGQPLNAGNLSVDVFTGNGSTTVFALTYSVGSSESVAIYLDGVKQAVSTYVAIGTVLTFTTAPPNLVGIEVVFLALSISLPTPGDGTVTAAKIVANAVDETKLKDALVADFTEVVVSASDSILLGDATDGGNTKRDTVQGILDLAPLDLSPYFNVSITGSFALADGVSTKVEWATEDLDSDSAFDVATNDRFTPLTAGKYFFSASMILNANGADRYHNSYVYLKKNGSIIETSAFDAYDNYFIYTANHSIGMIVDMNGSTDYIELFAIQNNTISSGNCSGNFCGFRISD